MSKKFAVKYREMKMVHQLAPPLFYHCCNGMVTVCVLHDGRDALARGMAILSYSEPLVRISRRTGGSKALGRAVKALVNGESSDWINAYRPGLSHRQCILLLAAKSAVSTYKSLRCEHSIPLGDFERGLIARKSMKSRERSIIQVPLVDLGQVLSNTGKE